MRELEIKIFNLVGKRERAEKRWATGDAYAEEEYRDYKKKVEDFLKENPDLRKHALKAEDYFITVLYNNV